MKLSNKHFTIFSILCMLTFSACNKTDKQNDTTISVASDEKKALAEKYPQVPKDELVTGKDQLTKDVFNELKERYKTDLASLHNSVSATGATLVIAFLTPEVGNSLTPGTRVGKSIIESLCTESKIPFYDLTKNISTMDPLVITQMPKDGHWSKKGAQVVADELKVIIDANSNAKSTTANKITNSIFGDSNPNEDKIADGGKNMPYRIKINAQGLRMNKDVEATKTKQRILFFGDSEMFFPFLDNDFIGTQLLQQMYPNKEILNAAMWGYTLNDYLTLYNEKAIKSSADLVVVVTNGNDILDYYFTNRNKLSRNTAATQPSVNEEKYYQTFLSKKH